MMLCGNHQHFTAEAHLPMCWNNNHCLCTPVFGLEEQLLNTKARGEANSSKQIHTRCSTTPHAYMILCRSEGMTKLSETCSSASSSSHVSLSLVGYLCLVPCSLIHLPALRGECRVSVMTQRPTNRLR